MLELALLTLAFVTSIGPTHLLALKEGVRKGALNTFWILAGGVLVDLFYANLSGLGLTAIGEDFYFKTILLSFGSFFFCYIGFKGLRTAFRKSFEKSAAPMKLHPLLTGIIMTLPNPFTIIFWATALTGLNIGYNPLLLLLVVVPVGFTWAAFEASIVHFSRKFINQKFLSIIEATSSLIILGFAGRFIWQLIEIIR